MSERHRMYSNILQFLFRIPQMPENVTGIQVSKRIINIQNQTENLFKVEPGLGFLLQFLRFHSSRFVVMLNVFAAPAAE